jgi:hypothetical protein
MAEAVLLKRDGFFYAPARFIRLLLVKYSAVAWNLFIFQIRGIPIFLIQRSFHW